MRRPRRCRSLGPWKPRFTCPSNVSWKSSALRSRARSAAAIWWRLSGDDPPVVVIGELKLTFNLELVLQAVDRAGACDEVWLAAKMSARGKGRESDARYRNLCRRLGFGMLAVTDGGEVRVIVRPATAAPRRDPKKRSRLVTEHNKRKGDPTLGGSTRSPIMTAYRQQALACASAMALGPRRIRDLKPAFPNAAEYPAGQFLRLVRPCRTRRLRFDRCRTRRAEAVAAATARGRRCRRIGAGLSVAHRRRMGGQHDCGDRQCGGAPG